MNGLSVEIVPAFDMVVPFEDVVISEEQVCPTATTMLAPEQVCALTSVIAKKTKLAANAIFLILSNFIFDDSLSY